MCGELRNGPFIRSTRNKISKPKTIFSTSKKKKEVKTLAYCIFRLLEVMESSCVVLRARLVYIMCLSVRQSASVCVCVCMLMSSGKSELINQQANSNITDTCNNTTTGNNKF